MAKQIDVGFKLGKLTVGGSLRGNLVNRVEIATPALTSMLVGGNAEFAEISVQDLDTQVASLTVNGAWIKSRFAMAINDGADDIFGTADDPAIANTAVGGIAKIVIKGQVTGTFDGTDSYRIRAPKIGSLSVAGTKYAFGAGAQTFGLGITNDVNATDVV